MFDEPFRRWFTRVASAPARVLHRAGVSPNALTIGAVALALVAAYGIARGAPFAGLALWIASRVLDGYDGMVARLSGRASPFGGFLDITADMLAYSGMAVGFALARPELSVYWLAVLVGYIMVITTTLALSSLLERADRQLGGDRSLQFTPALAEAGETSVVYVLLVLWPSASRIILVAWIVLLALTVIGRLRLARRLLA